MKDQSRAAIGRFVEWHVAEAPFADYLRAYAGKKEYANIIVIYTPPVIQ